ncbi:Gfo/Idh/MocA family protein [Actinospongicola halichondriae]|uniref:Gfo/Idh/MocA family protein n=1 Tax=Actinospongicola halichondriae TaxID=3236844 RepID=UPI003D4F4B0E
MTSIDAPVRVGFLGAGFIATFHSKMLRASGVDHERAGVFDPDGSRAGTFVARAGGFVAASEDEVLDSCDAVYVCTWTSEHPRLVEKACAAGRAVFVEKPLGVDESSSQRVVDAIESSGVVHQVGLILRYSPAFALVESFLAERDACGRVMSVVFRDDQFLPTGGHYQSTWRGDRNRAGSGVLLEHSIHDVDLLDRLVGPVTAVTGRSRSFHDIDGIEDLVVATFDLADGGIGTLTTVWHDLTQRPSLRYLEIHCERMHVEVEGDWFGPVRITRGDERIDVAGNELLALCDRRGIVLGDPEGSFIEAVAAGRPSAPSAATAMRAHRIVDGIYASAASGGVSVPTA